MKRRRLAGTRWRVLAWGAPICRGGDYGREIALASSDDDPSVFDELVIDSWLHLEQMDSGLWWMRLGGTNFNIHVDRDGRATEITDYDGDVYPVVER